MGGIWVIGQVVPWVAHRIEDTQATGYWELMTKDKTMILVIATARFDPADIEKVRDLGRTMITASRAEEGCLEYNYAQDILDQGALRVVELWKDEDALRFHFATPHMAAFQTGLAALNITDVIIDVFTAGEKRTIADVVGRGGS